MKFSFINPGPNPELPVEDIKKMVGAAPPLGMLYIATFLRKNGLEVSILDEAPQGFSLKDTIDWVKKENPNILGFSTCSATGRKAALIAKKVKQENPNIITVFGNFFATFNAKRILEKCLSCACMNIANVYLAFEPAVQLFKKQKVFAEKINDIKNNTSYKNKYKIIKYKSGTISMRCKN